MKPKASVLVAEDEDQARESLRALLEEEGYRALPVTPTGELNDVEIISEGEKPEMKMLGVFSQRHAAMHW